ncbi:hypothetical protein [Leifsonia aquatica]|uniref:hypothetical protein n=1 Tax=Leifsonia aquatica TaxID=144185 RepID=UPI0038079DA9
MTVEPIDFEEQAESVAAACADAGLVEAAAFIRSAGTVVEQQRQMRFRDFTRAERLRFERNTLKRKIRSLLSDITTARTALIDGLGGGDTHAKDDLLVLAREAAARLRSVS